MNELFPIYLKLSELRTLVVGAGPVGLEKLEAIYRNSPTALVYVVALNATSEFLKFISDKQTVFFEQRAFEEKDLDGKDIAILATNNDDLNQEIRSLARKRNLLLNVADKPDLCDFYLGSVVQKGNLKIGISTNGKSPTIAKRVKDFLNDVIPDEIDETLELLQQMRNGLKGDFQEKVRVLNENTKNLLS